MPAPAILFDEHAALDALRQFITTVLPEVPQVDVYRARPSAVPAKWGLSVVLTPTTPLPVLASYQGDQSTVAQRQLARLVFTTAAAGPWTATVLGQTSAAYVAGGGDSVAKVRDEVLARLDDLGLPVTLTPSVGLAGGAGVDVLADVAGASMLASVSAPAGGAASVVVVDDNLRRASFNWGQWTIRVTVRDIPNAGGTERSMVGAYLERLRLSMQAGATVPITSGLAYPTLGDQMGGASQVPSLPAGAAMCWRQTLGPFTADVLESGVWTRGAAVDLVFDTPCAVYFDVPSLDRYGVPGFMA